MNIKNISAGIISWIIFPALIVWMGYSHIGPLFRGEYTQHLGSIEVSYIQMAKFISDSWPQFAWQPNWYMGYPMWVLYTPFVPFAEFILRSVVGWSFSHGYRVLTAVGYIGGLVSLYFFARALFKNSTAGIIAALSYGILPSLIALLFPEVAGDTFSDIIDPRRFTILVRWGEGPHIISLLFMPLAGWGLVSFLRDRGRTALILGSLCAALTALTNSVGAWGLFILGVSLVFGQIIEENDVKKVLGRAVFFALLSFGLAAFWFNPLFLSSFFREGGNTMSIWKEQFPWGWLLLFAGFAVYYFISQKVWAKAAGISAALLFFFIMFGLVYTYYASEGDKTELVPQVLRLNTEVDIGVGLVIAAVVSGFGQLLNKKGAALKTIGMSVCIVTAGLLLWNRQMVLTQDLPKHTIPLEETDKKLESIPEYEVAKLIEENVTGEARVFASGNYGFYLDYFTDVPQLRGALFQSAIHPWAEHIYYQVVTGKDPQIKLDLLKIANVGWFLMSGPRDIYQDVKFDKALLDDIFTKVAETPSGDILYEVPLLNSRLTKIVPESILDAKIPKNAIDKEPIAHYVELLEQSQQEVSTREVRNGEYEIKGTIGEGELLLTHMTYVPGWTASSNKRKLEVSQDPMGFIAIKPRVTGEQVVTLKYRTPWQVWSGWVVTIFTMLVCAGIIFYGRKSPVQINTKAGWEEAKQEE